MEGIAHLSQKGKEQDKFKFGFDFYDHDRDGLITPKDLQIVIRMIVGGNLSQQQIDQLIQRTFEKADLDRDGALNFEEFRKITQNLDILSKLTLSYQ